MSSVAQVLQLCDAKRAPLYLFALAVLVRLVLVAFLHDSYYTSGMAQGELARNIAEGRGFVVHGPFADSIGHAQWEEGRLIDVAEALSRFSPADSADLYRPFIAYMMPGQGMLLSAWYSLTGWYSYLPLQITQAIIDALGVFLIIGIASMVLDRRVGVFAAALFAVYVPEARLAITATRDAWMPILYLSMTFLAVRSWKSGATKDYILLGAATAAAAYFRSEVMLVPLWLGFFLLLARKPVRQWAPRIALSTLVIALALAPWTMRNYNVFGKIIPTNSGLWLAMWQSFGEYENDFGAVNNDQVTVDQMRAKGHTEAFDTPEYDALFRPMVLTVVKEEPIWVAWTMVRRLARIPLQLHAWGIGLTDDFHEKGSPYGTGKVDQASYMDLLLSDPARLVVHALARTLNLILYLAVLVWFLVSRPQDRTAGLILFAVPLYNILVHVVIGVHARYILPTNAVHLLFLSSLVIDYVERRFTHSDN